jgi:hypothetical protein
VTGERPAVPQFDPLAHADQTVASRASGGALVLLVAIVSHPHMQLACHHVGHQSGLARTGRVLANVRQRLLDQA